MNDLYVIRLETGESVFGPARISDAVAKARELAKSGERYAVRRQNGVLFETYPDADLKWKEWERLGLVPRD